MASPRWLTWRARWAAALACVAGLAGGVTVPCSAQSSSATPAGADSLAPRPDTARPAAGAAQTGGATTPNDTAAPPPPPPIDSALGAACVNLPGGRPDILLVRFRATATDAERAAVAREVGGKLIGRSEHNAPGAWLLHVPGSGADRSVADRLIMLSPVTEVTGTRCPRPPRPTR
jgi:hypothetical protein